VHSIHPFQEVKDDARGAVIDFLLEKYKCESSIFSEAGLHELKTSITVHYKEVLDFLDSHDFAGSSQPEEGNDPATRFDSLQSVADRKLWVICERLRGEEAGPTAESQPQPEGDGQPQPEGDGQPQPEGDGQFDKQLPSIDKPQPQPQPRLDAEDQLFGKFWMEIKDALSTAPISNRFETLMTALRGHHQIAADDVVANKCLSAAYRPFIRQLIPGGDVVPWGLFLRTKEKKAWHEELLANLCKCSGDFLRR